MMMMMMMMMPNYGKAVVLVRRKPSIECGGRERPTCHSLSFLD